MSRQRSLRIRERWQWGVAIPAAFCACLLPAYAQSTANPPAIDVPTSLSEAEALLAKFFAAADQVADYRMIMDKQQRTNGELPPVERMQVEHRRSPDCRYMRWIGERNNGREMIYCPDRYDGMIKVHNGGLMSLITVSLDPDGERITKNQLHRISESGLFAMTDMVRKDNDYIRQHPELAPPQLSHREIAGAASTCIDMERGADMFKAYHLGRQSICLDDHLNLPTELQLWNADGELMEHFTYSNYAVNIGLTDVDFDTKNGRYHF
jgi:hypothetical protein